MADKFTIGLVQMKCTANAEQNLARAIDKIREAARRGAQRRRMPGIGDLAADADCRGAVVVPPGSSGGGELVILVP